MDPKYAYEQGYERGWGGHPPPQRDWPSEVPRRGLVADCLKAGWVDGQYDREEGNEYGTSRDFEDNFNSGDE